MLRNLLMVLQLLSSLAIIGLVLLQRGKGADAGAGFGAGASGTVFGARGARTALSRATAVFAAIFMVNSLALAYMGTRRAQEAAPTSILDEAGQTPPPAQQNSVPAPSTPATGTEIPAPASGGATSEVPAPNQTP